MKPLPVDVAEMSHALRRRFVKDCDLPIQLVQSPYFEYFIDLYDRFFPKHGGVYARLASFSKCVSDCGGEKEFFEEDAVLKASVISHVKEKKEFVKWFCDSALNLTDFKERPKFNVGENLYREDNAGIDLVSLDIVSGNFRALRFLSPEIVDGKNNYDEFIGQFTNHDHFIQSKHIRQYIFGNLNPKRQILIQKELMFKLYIDLLIQFGGNRRICSSSHDELVIPAESQDLFRVDKALSNMREQYDLPGMPFVKVDHFRLVRIAGTKFYVKCSFNGRKEFKCVPSCLFAQVFKQYMNLELCDMDLAFYHEGRVARFVEPYFSDSPVEDDGEDQ